MKQNIAEVLAGAFASAGLEEGAIYLSVAITSGQRELALMRELRCTSLILRTQHTRAWRERVVTPNSNEATELAVRVRELFPHQVVVNPAALDVPGWSQAEYGAFWDQLIERFAGRIVLSPGWAWSKGCRVEVNVAIRLQLPILDIDGHVATTSSLDTADRAARQWMRDVGFDDPQITDYLPVLDLPAYESAFGVADSTVHENKAAAEAFSWLRGERDYQLRKFGTQQDDLHTRSGLAEESWWWRQLQTYYHRAQVLGLDAPLGRQALAKYVATAMGLLESVIRIHGPLPPPGVPSGENRADGTWTQE